MNSKLAEKSESSIKPSASVISGNGFNFEQWANEVRPQLLAALKKRGSLAKLG